MDQVSEGLDTRPFRWTEYRFAFPETIEPPANCYPKHPAQVEVHRLQTGGVVKVETKQ
jgi:hypothetical protein